MPRNASRTAAAGELARGLAMAPSAVATGLPAPLAFAWLQLP